MTNRVVSHSCLHLFSRIKHKNLGEREKERGSGENRERAGRETRRERENISNNKKVMKKKGEREIPYDLTYNGT